MDFLVGDQVRAVDASPYTPWLINGHVYRVIKVLPGDVIRFVGEDGLNQHAFARRFELAHRQ